MNITEDGYILPSDNRLSLTSTYGDTPISMNQLVNQFYDDSLEMCVYNLKNYNVGDPVKMQDNIHTIEYDADNDCTIFTFATQRGNVEWKFGGDWTSHYQSGNEIALCLNVQELCESAGIQFETIDYLNSVANNIMPDLNDYLMNN